MSQQGPLRDHAGGGGQIMTLSSEGGPPTPPVGNNFNFSGSIAGGSAANGAIEFITPGGPGAATNGQMDAVVLTDGVTIQINGSNELEVIGGVFPESFNVDASTPPGTDPVVPSGLGVVTVTGGQVAAGVVGTNVIRTDSLAANTYTIEIQRSQAIGVSTLADNGVCHFDSSGFSVDANGFVTLAGGGGATTNIDVDAFTAPGTDPVVPNAGNIIMTGAQVAAGVVGANVIRTDSLAANTVTIEIQRSAAVGASASINNGVSHFNSAEFTVDANGFVSLAGGGLAIDSIAVQTGTSPIVPTAGGLVTINGAVVAAGTNPVRTDGTGANTMALEVQISQAIASTNATNIGLAAFDSADFTVDANGFVSLSGAGAGQTITGDTGGALSPTAGNWNILALLTAGSSVSFSGSGSTLSLNTTDSSSNTLIGSGAGNATTTALNCTGLGINALHALQNSQNCTGIGRAALQSVLNGAFNTAIGASNLANITTGNHNTAIGNGSGSSYNSSESSNILVGSNLTGTTGESNVIRIGTQGTGDGQQNRCFIAGIVGVTPSNQQTVVIDSTTGQLGVSSGDVVTWNVVSTNQTGTTNNGYIFVSPGGALTISLPTTSAVGDQFSVMLDGATSWQITQAAGQSVRLSSLATTVGAGGSLTSTAQGDTVTLICRVANTTWTALSSIGNITVV